MLRSDKPVGGDAQMPIHFGAFLKMLRNRHGIRQSAVLACLSGWTQASYSRVETGEVAPAFDQLFLLLTALQEAGVKFTPADRQRYLLLARRRIEAKKTYHEHKSEQEWDHLSLLLAQVTGGSDEPRSWLTHSHQVETRHLIGREEWLDQVLTTVQGEMPKKLVILQGPVGIGKSSELHRVAVHFLRVEVPRPHVVFCGLPVQEEERGSENALDMVLATILAELGPVDSSTATLSLQTRITLTLQRLEKTSRPFVLLVDNGERILDDKGQLSLSWEQFLTAFLRSEHRACLIIATREWPGRFEGERLFLAEYRVPALSEEAGALLLSNLGLTSVPRDYLRRASAAVGGVPLCLEWLVSLVQEPLLSDHWEEHDEWDEPAEEPSVGGIEETPQTKRLVRLLEDAPLFGGPIASKLTPLLDRLIEKRLSSDAYHVLCTLSLANIPLGKPALQVLCPRPRLLKELSIVSLLAAYTNRVQLLPMVASLICSHLSDEQRWQLEDTLIVAYVSWLEDGKIGIQEAGAIVAELAVLYLKHQRLLDAAQLLTHHGWMSFNLGYGLLLANTAANATKQSSEWINDENEIGILLLNHLLFPFLGKAIDYKERMNDYQSIHGAALAGRVRLAPSMEIAVVHQLIWYTISELHFEHAFELLEQCRARLEALYASDQDGYLSLLEDKALLFARWSEYAKEQGDVQKGLLLKEQSIELYRQCVKLLSSYEELSPFRRSILKRSLARCLGNLAYNLNNAGLYEEALQMVERAIILKEKGYSYIGALAASYGEKSQILAALGHFREALLFDEKALVEIQRCADSGDRLSQEEFWIYNVNRARLYLLLGRVHEAEQLLQESLSHIQPRRRMYFMLGKEALDEIAQWRLNTSSSHYQLDWRWIERYRELDAFDAYWWWAHAGPFTEEEQRQWKKLLSPILDETTKSCLGKLLAQARERELVNAIAQQREPRLCYPTIDIEEVRRRIIAFEQLETEIERNEPNSIVRRLYQDKIEEEIHFLRMIEATYEGNNEKYREFSQLVYPKPTLEEMEYALSHVYDAVQRGMLDASTVDVSQKLLLFLHQKLLLSFNPQKSEQESERRVQNAPQARSEPEKMISSETAKRFFEAAFREGGYEGWQVMIDPKVSTPRVESGLRHLFLPDALLSLERVEHYLVHEFAGHIARSVAGERSPLGLLAIGTKNYSPTEEGLALYYEYQEEALQGRVPNKWSAWFGTLVTGLASGVNTPPQTFLALFTFLELFFLLWRLLEHLDTERQEAEDKARKSALSTCLRVYRGVPDLEQAGVCLCKDSVYLRGLWVIERAVAKDETILARLAVGRTAIEYLPELEQLGIVAPLHSLTKLARDPHLEEYILTFQEEENTRNNV